MPRTRAALLLSPLLLSVCCAAQATNLELSGQISGQISEQIPGQTPGPGSAPTSVQGRPLLRAELTELPLGPGQGAAFGVSTHAAFAGYRQSLSLPALGGVQAEARLAHPWSGGLRLKAQLDGSAGPVALNLGGEVFSAPLTEEDPLAAWEAGARDLRAQGWNLTLGARARLSRFLTLHASGELGGQPSALTELEWRRAPRQELRPDSTGDFIEDGDTTDTTLLLRGGVQAGRGVLGLRAGVTYRTEQGLDLSADALLGAQPGLSARLSLPPLGENELSAYASYEPWRQTSAQVRYGADLSRPLGRGQLSVSVRGGSGPGSTGQSSSGPGSRSGFGAELRYILPLGNAAP